MPRNIYIAFGVLLLILGSLAAGCAAPEATRDEPEVQRPYRIQVDMTPNKQEADRRLAQVRSWWDELPDDERPAPLAESGLQPDIVWQQPYYRVRIGHFVSREAAADALAAVKEQFSDAFIARERAPAARR